MCHLSQPSAASLFYSGKSSHLILTSYASAVQQSVMLTTRRENRNEPEVLDLTATAAQWAQGIVGPNSRSRHGSIGLAPVCLSLTVHTGENKRINILMDYVSC